MFQAKKKKKKKKKSDWRLRTVTYTNTSNKHNKTVQVHTWVRTHVRPGNTMGGFTKKKYLTSKFTLSLGSILLRTTPKSWEWWSEAQIQQQTERAKILTTTTRSLLNPQQSIWRFEHFLIFKKSLKALY